MAKKDDTVLVQRYCTITVTRVLRVQHSLCRSMVLLYRLAVPREEEYNVVCDDDLQ